jgi:hypothetical protein
LCLGSSASLKARRESNIESEANKKVELDELNLDLDDDSSEFEDDLYSGL